MNAHARQLFVDGLLSKTRQSVHICRTTHGASPLGPRYVVLVDGEYYEIGRRTLAALRDGITPAELELEPYDHDDDEHEEAGEHPDSLRRWYHGRAL